MITLPSGRKIGTGQPPFIIAEVGSNWTSLEDCKRSIAQAKQAGADAVKFQLFDWLALYGTPTEQKTPDGLSLHDDFNTVLRGVLPLDWLPILAEKARLADIEFMCSAFSPGLVRAVDPYVSIHKVASAELTHLRILEAVRDTGKPVILSTGASGPEDIKRALRILDPEVSAPSGQRIRPFNAGRVLMYCVAAYPARDIDFRMLDELRERFGCPVGYSDHTTDYGVIPRTAIERGACVLEKHFTAIEADTPDRPHSLTVDEFRRMVQSIRGERPFVWGSGEEKDMITRHNRRLIATKEVKAGQAFKEGENFGIFRSLVDDTRGYSGFAVEQVHDRPAAKDIQAGQAIGPGDVTL